MHRSRISCRPMFGTTQRRSVTTTGRFRSFPNHLSAARSAYRKHWDYARIQSTIPEGVVGMRRKTSLLIVVAIVVGVVAYKAPASGQTDGEAAPIFVTRS